MNRTLGGHPILKWLRQRPAQHVTFDHLLAQARSLSRTPLMDAYAPARRLQELLERYRAAHEAAWQKTLSRGGAAATQVRQKNAVIDQMSEALQHLHIQLLKQVQSQVASDDRNAGHIAAEQTAGVLSRRLSVQKADAGSSEVQLLKRHNGRVMYAFKPLLKESAQNLLPLGGAGLREKLCDVASRQVAQDTGLQLGFPQVELVCRQGEHGALIEGIPGHNLDLDAAALRMAPTEEGQQHLQRTRRVWDACTRQLPASELQRAMLAHLAMGSYDLKWGNVMVLKSGQVRPIDGGCAFPNRMAMAAMCAKPMVPDGLCMSPTGHPLPSAQHPFDPVLREQFLRIDAGRLENVLEHERQRLLAQLPAQFLREARVIDRDQLLDAASVRAGVQSLRVAQQILREDPGCSMAALAQRHAQRLQAAHPPGDLLAYERARAQVTPDTRGRLASFQALFEQSVQPQEPTDVAHFSPSHQVRPGAGS